MTSATHNYIFVFLTHIAISKPCTLSVRVVAVAGLSEHQHFSLKFCSPMEYLYHKMRHDPHRTCNNVEDLCIHSYTTYIRILITYMYKCRPIAKEVL